MRTPFIETGSGRFDPRDYIVAEAEPEGARRPLDHAVGDIAADVV